MDTEEDQVSNLGTLGSCDTPDSAEDVYVTRSYAYVADRGSGLQVIEKFNPFTDVTYILKHDIFWASNRSAGTTFIRKNTSNLFIIILSGR